MATNHATLSDVLNQHISLKNLSTEETEALWEEYRAIISQNLEEYFLSLKNKDIKVKNSAQSWVAYAIGITDEKPTSTDIDRLKISEQGSTAVPDIDCDFSKHKRHLVKQHLIEKYGKDRVASVGTLSLLKTKVALKDVARALGYPYEVQDTISKTIDEEFGGGSQNIIKETVKQIAQIVEASPTNYPKVKGLIDQYPDVFEAAQKIEMSPRQWGMHAGAIVITPVPMSDCMPVRMQKSRVKGEEGLITTQLDKNALEELGALKADVLGLESLGIMEDTVELIYKRTGEKIDINTIPFDDQKTWDVISQGQTLGSFQICTPGIRNICKQYKPRNINDLGAIIAIYRPGPLENGMDKEFIDRKWGRKEITYLKPEDKTKSILEDTLGIIVYQEQCMMIAVAVAGYSPGEADVLRKVISKSKKEAMMAERDKFVKGCVAYSGLSEKEANDLFNLIETFGRYGFNKSHSISYAVLGYQMMYLKTNYPLEFMTAWFNNKTLEKIVAECIPEAKRLGIRIVAPDINRSLVQFTYDDIKKEIVFGLSRIKGCGDSASTAILEERKNGPFNGLIDIIERVPSLNKKALEVIAAAGGLHYLGYRRENVIDGIEELKALIKKKGSILSRITAHKEKTDEIRLDFKSQLESLISQINSEQDESNQKKLKKQFNTLKVKRDKAKDKAINRNNKLLEELKEVENKISSFDEIMKGKETLTEVLAYEYAAIECHISGHPLDDDRISFMRKYLPAMKELEELMSNRISDGEVILFPALFKDGKETIARKSKKPMYVMTFTSRTSNIVSRAFGRKILEMKGKLQPGEIFIIKASWSNKYGIDIIACSSLNNFFRNTFKAYAERKGIDISSMII